MIPKSLTLVEYSFDSMVISQNILIVNFLFILVTFLTSIHCCPEAHWSMQTKQLRELRDCYTILRWSYLQIIVSSIGKSAQKMTIKPYSVISNAFLHGPLTGWWISTSKSVRFCQSHESATLGYINTIFSMRSSQGSINTYIVQVSWGHDHDQPSVG